VTTFSSVLVANRGEIARRIFRTAHAMGLHCTAVFAAADRDAPFVAEADEAVCLPGGYLDAQAIIDAARVTGTAAIHPGYGFLSENSAFAAGVVDAGLVWVGPSASVIEAMGDKLAAKRAAIAAGVPTLPSSDDVRRDGDVGYPLLVKAAAGGGGKGMRIVSSPSALHNAIEGARREAAAAFGDDRVFLERYVPHSRHIEIQILGDQHGNLVHLGERECSIQRRHQKVLEESPSSVIDAQLRTAIGEAALRLAGSIGYESAGTVEFLLDDETREFFFLEVNTRLQVEHPVTEMVTGIDLVREQFRIAMGDPLGYSQEAVSFDGHAIEARLYAEDPQSGFLPATGRLLAYSPPAEPSVRWDSGVERGSSVGVEFDPMLAKVIAHGPTRSEAAMRLALALERLHLGGVTTNRAFLVSTLRHPAFLAGDTTTDFIERVRPATSASLPESELNRLLAVSALWLQGKNRSVASALAPAPSGWRNGRLAPQRVTLTVRGSLHTVDYLSRRDGSFTMTIDTAADAVPGRVHHWSDTAVDAEVDRRRALHYVTWGDDQLFVQMSSGTFEVGIVSRFPSPNSEGPAGAMIAPMPGVVLDVGVAPASKVEAGHTLVVLEAMKMEHHISAPVAGIVTEVLVGVGQQVKTGELLLVLEPLEGDGPEAATAVEA
jgi:propionyl-CoA carboxylase alpha chain